MKETPRAESFADGQAWRAWLAENHQSHNGLWLLFHKRHTGRSGLTYVEALEEALCFGWIDGIVKRIDGEKHMIRFSPRRKNSIWSEHNKKRVRRLIRQGRMTPTGLARVREARANGQWTKAAVREDITIVPAELMEALARNEKARLRFESLAPSYRRQFIYWVAVARRDETRRRRIEETIELLVRNEKLGPR
ncbi:MAG: YdeI/OmpD-associated family protein [Sedimentisphaerales bacterium]|nr:YdeI/OmpD-associated family protein [Sedimentisphaerales bacterium]